MKNGHFEEHWVDEDGNPAGGVSDGCGFSISWQNGPLGRGDERDEPNGAFVEDLIQALIGRMEFYQEASGGKFACVENEAAIRSLRDAGIRLEDRTRHREAQGVEGTNQVHG